MFSPLGPACFSSSPFFPRASLLLLFSSHPNCICHSFREFNHHPIPLLSSSAASGINSEHSLHRLARLPSSCAPQQLIPRLQLSPLPLSSGLLCKYELLHGELRRISLIELWTVTVVNSITHPLPAPRTAPVACQPLHVGTIVVRLPLLATSTKTSQIRSAYIHRAIYSLRNSPEFFALQ